ncbi:MAG: prolipoprotein diacylglyceryl transferase [Gammaproteobacteria bacterium]|nr:prolipoprotein diacylglyceryl transferase [Gammaproteobacteria bacterium]
MIVHPNFDPVAISIGPLSIHWYGLMYLCGFVAGIWLGRYRASQANSGWDPEEISDLVFYAAVGVILGGRLGYVLFYNMEFYIANPLDIFAMWDGGMSFHGGVLGVFVAALLYSRKTQRSILNVGDFLVPLVPLGLFFGRVGNFINQELWGHVTDVPWAVYFHTAPDGPRHPSQLYEALFEGLVLFALIWWFSSKNRKAGQISGLFFLGYGVCRFFIEFFRQPDAHLGAIAFDWMSMGQLLSIPMVLFGLFLLLRKTDTKSNHQVPS